MAERRQPNLPRVDVSDFPRYPEIPPTYRAAIKSIARRFDPHEDFVSEAGKLGEEDWGAALEILQGYGVFDEEFVTDIRSAAQEVFEYYYRNGQRAKAAGIPKK